MVSKMSSLLLLALVGFAYSAKLFDADKCPNGCKSDDTCPENAACVSVNGDTGCGLCICRAGFKAQLNKCKETAGGGGGGVTTRSTVSRTSATTEFVPDDTTQATQEPSVATDAPTTEAVTTPTTTLPTTQGTTTQGGPPAPEPLVCSDYSCKSTVTNNDAESDDNPLKVRSQLYNETDCKRKVGVTARPCQMVGGGACYGIYCLTVSAGNDYCICPYYRVDRQCVVEKPGKCESATGNIPPNAYQAQNKRFRSKNNPDNGSVYGRHFASSLSECVKLCQWTAGSCKTVNFGQINGVNVCEMLSITISKGGLLESWLVDAPGWQFVQAV